MVKTLTVTEEAYERLSARKGKGESFSQVIIKLTGSFSPLNLVGILPDKNADEIRRSISERRKDLRERLDKTGGELA